MKWLVACIAAVLIFVPAHSHCSDSLHGHKHKTSAKKSTKCWRHQNTLNQSRSSWPAVSGEADICIDYEKVLNTTCEPPEQLQCNWTLPPGEKHFKKLEWKDLDLKDPWPLIQDLALSGWAEKYRPGKWEIVEPDYRKQWQGGLLKLKTTRVDIDHDGIEEQLVLMKRGICGKDGWKDIYGVIDPETGRLNPAFDPVVGNMSGSMGAQIMLYDNQAVMFGWVSGFSRAFIWKGFKTSTGRGAIDICGFDYLKGGSK